MAVEIKYVVVREGEEKMSFASKKEADAWDKMLDLAEAMSEWLTQSPVALEPEQADALAMWLAQEKEALTTLLKTGHLPQAVASRAVPHADAAPEPAPRSTKKQSKAA